MGITERREREKIERRKTILRCAKELILLQGVDRVSIKDIARKAELSKATVYLYFSSKELLLNEICEEAAVVFLKHISLLEDTSITGIEALNFFWRGFVDLFRNSDELIIIFKVRNFLESSLSNFLLKEQSKSPNVDSILEAMKNLIEKCKAEGFFDPNLDSTMATNLLLSTFSIIVEKAATISQKVKNSPVLMVEMANSFQIIIRGFAREGINHSYLDILNA